MKLKYLPPPKLLVIFLAVSLLHLGCSDSEEIDDEPGVTTTEAEREIIFGDYRNVEQSRGQWRHAEQAGILADQYADANDDDAEREHRARMARLVQSALASRGTAYVRGTVWYTGGDVACTQSALLEASGQLSSSSRLVTARHVAEPLDAYEGCESHIDQAA